MLTRSARSGNGILQGEVDTGVVKVAITRVSGNPRGLRFPSPETRHVVALPEPSRCHTSARRISLAFHRSSCVDDAPPLTAPSSWAGLAPLLPAGCLVRRLQPRRSPFVDGIGCRIGLLCPPEQVGSLKAGRKRGSLRTDLL